MVFFVPVSAMSLSASIFASALLSGFAQRVCFPAIDNAGWTCKLGFQSSTAEHVGRWCSVGGCGMGSLYRYLVGWRYFEWTLSF